MPRFRSHTTHLGGVLRNVEGEVFGRKTALVAKLQAMWIEVAGDLADWTQPKSLYKGVLTVAVARVELLEGCIALQAPLRKLLVTRFPQVFVRDIVFMPGIIEHRETLEKLEEKAPPPPLKPAQVVWVAEMIAEFPEALRESFRPLLEASARRKEKDGTE